MRLATAGLIALTLITIHGVAAAQASLDATLQRYVAKHELPALGAAVVRSGRVVASGAAGTRRAGSRVPATVRDRFHLGSDTKAMTALLAGMLVDEGKLRWTSTIGEVFPEHAAAMDAG
jgi:CubicO group peptidase (beta-lactamase class C family)